MIARGMSKRVFCKTVIVTENNEVDNARYAEKPRLDLRSMYRSVLSSTKILHRASKFLRERMAPFYTDVHYFPRLPLKNGAFSPDDVSILHSLRFRYL